ncbi:hypothetical protein M3Y99_01369200 [Aphelenchoides fujianensis]|nr:hypothetical protein M3Y99_01369200 [Aphelenchoides fujianensis]
MKVAVVKRKPQIRAAVRDGLNRFQLVDKMETNETKGTAHLVRLAAISRAHQESVRRSARGIKFVTTDHEWQLRLKLGVGAPKIIFPVGHAEMIAVIRLLGVPVALRFWMDVDWKALEPIGRYVNALTLMHDYPACSAFVGSVASHLRVLTSTWSVVARLPPLDLEKARLYKTPNDYSELNQHKIRRLDVPVFVLDGYPGRQSNQVISSSIKTVGIFHLDYAAAFPYDSIAAFCRRFPSLEDLHIHCYYEKEIEDVSAYFTRLWANCLEIRDRLHVAGLKRFFLKINHDCRFFGTKSDWFEKLKLVEPFDKATSTIDRSNERIRMFLKHNEPRAAKPTFVLIKGDFHWINEEGANDERGD